MKPKPTIKHARKFLATIKPGLSSGLGEPKPGFMCVEAAWCFALGLPHGDDPKCVGNAVRSFKIALNDCSWSSNKARANGMAAIGLAQIGSDTLDQVEFAKRLALETTRRLLPPLLRIVAKGCNAQHKKMLLECACDCENANDLTAARDASYASAASASSAARDASYASYASYASAASAASSASSAAIASSYASYASAASAARAASSASSAAIASSAARDASYASAASDRFLRLMANIGLDVLKDMKSPGCRFLKLLEE